MNAYRLSPTQARIAVLLAARLTNREIAEVMGCRYDTARKHVEMVMMRMLVHRREDILYRLQELVVEEGVRSPPRPIVASLDSAS